MSRQDKVRAKYAAFSDKLIIQIATEEAHELSDLGYQVLLEEISHRGLFEQNSALDNSFPSIDEIIFFIELIENLPCPGCGLNNSYLKTRVARKVAKANYQECTIIGCEDCITKWDRDIRAKTYKNGWRSFPSGIIKTISAFYYNKDAANSRFYENETTFRKFVLQNIGYLRAFQNDQGRLLEFLVGENAKRF